VRGQLVGILGRKSGEACRPEDDGASSAAGPAMSPAGKLSREETATKKDYDRGRLDSARDGRRRSPCSRRQIFS
jgi:hypothetical protein